jgi:hypothetical protein
VAVEVSPIAAVLQLFLEKRGSYRAPALQLLRELNNFPNDTADTARKNPRWPRSANGLSGELGRIEPDLKRMGIVVVRGRTPHNGRYISLELYEPGVPHARR